MTKNIKITAEDIADEARIVKSRGIKCLICNQRDMTVANGGKFTCDTCRNFLIRQNHYYTSGESDTIVIETRDEYVARMREVLDMPEIGTVRSA